MGANSSRKLALMPVLVVLAYNLVASASAQETAGTATSQTFPNSDITGNDIDCGQPAGQLCAVCKAMNKVTQSCATNFKCKAVVFNGTCGFLKSSGDAAVRVPKTGSTVIVITNANEIAAVVASQYGANNTTSGEQEGFSTAERGVGEAGGRTAANNNGGSSAGSSPSNGG